MFFGLVASFDFTNDQRGLKTDLKLLHMHVMIIILIVVMDLCACSLLLHFRI